MKWLPQSKNLNQLILPVKPTIKKKKIVIDLIFKMCNYTDLSATALDWSTSTMPLFINPQMVLSFVQQLNFDRICAALTGVKTGDEIFKIIFCEL